MAASRSGCSTTRLRPARGPESGPSWCAPSDGSPSHTPPKTHCPAQADTLAAKAWACLVTQAAPLLRAGKETSLLFLSVQGEPLVGHNTLCNIATAQLAAAGLPGQTARSVGLPGCLVMSSLSLTAKLCSFALIVQKHLTL